MSDPRPSDLRWLDAAAFLATPSLGATGATPAVGAIVVDTARQMVFGRAVTPPNGISQAVPLALAGARGLTQGRTLYVTLEPAAHYTSLAPVVGAVIESGVSRVVVGALDPDRDHAGEGLRDLADAGIEVAYVPHEPSRLLNEGHATLVRKGRPFVTMKLTLSADGMAGYNAPGRPPLLGLEARRYVERQRAAADAVMSGAARLAIDNADLAIHLGGLDARAPLRVLLAGTRELDPGLALLSATAGPPVMVVTTHERPLTLPETVEVLAVDDRRGHPDLHQVFAVLAGRGMSRVFVEAGARLAEALIAGELVDRIHIIDIAAELGRDGVPAALLGRFEDRIAAARFSEVDRRVLGEDKVRTLDRL